ncbi:MAG TPA: PAS domain-containing sensor histidine kinase [Alphaproteobacteria bacterium]|nr:PAS domain-containing sensor histidine kinase [Alphaproteobacteria bacterium]
MSPPISIPSPLQAAWLRLREWARRTKMFRKVSLWLTVVSVAVGLITFSLIMLRVPVLGGDNTIKALLSLCLFCLVALSVLVSYRLLRIIAVRRQGKSGSVLQLRMVSVFSLLAVTPTIIVALFAGLFFSLGVQGWFSERVQRVVDESMEVAKAYLNEHQQAIRADTLAMVNDINREAPRLVGNTALFNQFIDVQSNARGLTEALVFDSTGKILGRSALSFSLEFEPVTEDMMERARAGETVLMIGQKYDKVRALAKIDALFDAYLLVGRLVEPRVLKHVETAEGAVAEYTAVKQRSGTLQKQLFLTFVVVALLLLLVAIWFGMNFANRLGTPLSMLVDMAEHVRTGDLSVRIQEKFLKYEDELGSLGRAFNRMTGQLESQRSELVDANRQLDTRRRFTEAVLSGVSAGVIGVDGDGRITLINSSAAGLLELTEPDTFINKPLLTLLPEMETLWQQIGQQQPARSVEGEVEIQRPNIPTKIFFVRISLEQVGEDAQGYVVTFDDVSELIAAQRKAAWGDVARRIAHEIKNPLTPIQLSAERLRKRYLNEITTDPDVFLSCLNTIIRQVDDIGRMVDEFSTFARMPKAVMQKQNVNDLVRHAVLLHSPAHADVDISTVLPPHAVYSTCDGRLIGQGLSNIIKNAIEAIEGRTAAEGQTLPRGHITASLDVVGDDIRISVEDNGKGLPTAQRHRLTEPYVTTRAKGTGLGLAIVKKIMEDHHGTLVIEDRIEGGARVILRFPAHPPSQAGSPVEEKPAIEHTGGRAV